MLSKIFKLGFSSYSTILNSIKHPEVLLYYAYNLSYSISSSQDYIGFVAELFDLNEEEVKNYLPNSDSRRILSQVLLKSMSAGLMRRPLSFKESLSLYLIIRILKPKIIVETGVGTGRSTAFILQALEDNNRGYLYSIDLNPGSGSAIPDHLKYRWFFILGESRDVLPYLLSLLKRIDIFLHDSSHTYENMTFEFENAWRFLVKGGVLLADNVDWNTAFKDFCIKYNLSPVCLSKKFVGVRKL